MGGLDWNNLVNKGLAFADGYLDRELLKDNFQAYAAFQSANVTQEPQRSEPSNGPITRGAAGMAVPSWVWLAVIGGGLAFVATR